MALSTATSWSSICGTVSSRIWTMGTTSQMCSTMCRRTRSCQPATPGRGAGRPQRSSSSNSWKSSGWGVGGHPDRHLAVLLALPLPGPGHPRVMVLRLGQGHCDAQTFVLAVAAAFERRPSHCQHSSFRLPKAVSKGDANKGTLAEKWLVLSLLSLLCGP